MTAYQRITLAPQSAAFFMPESRPANTVHVAGYGDIPRGESCDNAVADVYLHTQKKLRWVRDDRTSKSH